MITAYTIRDANGVDIPVIDSLRRLGEVSGLHGMPAPRRIVRDRPGGHGEIHDTQHAGSRQPVLTGTLLGTTSTELWEQYDTILQTLWDAVDTPRLHKWTRADGTLCQSLMRVGEAFDPVLRAADRGVLLRYQVTFDREDPRNYDQALSTVNGDALSDAAGGLVFPEAFPIIFTGSGAGTAAVSNTGTVASPATFTIHGFATGPDILHVETGRRIVIDGELSVGDTLEVDTFSRTVLLNGTTDRTNLVNFAETNWDAGMVPRGSSTYRLIAGNFDGSARLDVAFRPAYA